MRISDRVRPLSLYNLKFSESVPDFACDMVFDFLQDEGYHPRFYLFDSRLSAVLTIRGNLRSESISDLSEFGYIKSIESVLDERFLVSR